MESATGALLLLLALQRCCSRACLYRWAAPHALFNTRRAHSAQSPHTQTHCVLVLALPISVVVVLTHSISVIVHTSLRVPSLLREHYVTLRRYNGRYHRHYHRAARDARAQSGLAPNVIVSTSVYGPRARSHALRSFVMWAPNFASSSCFLLSAHKTAKPTLRAHASLNHKPMTMYVIISHALP